MNDIVLGLLRAIRDGDGGAALPLSDQLEELGWTKEAQWLRSAHLDTERVFAGLARSCDLCDGQGCDCCRWTGVLWRDQYSLGPSDHGRCVLFTASEGRTVELPRDAPVGWYCIIGNDWTSTDALEVRGVEGNTVHLPPGRWVMVGQEASATASQVVAADG